ncbi:glycoside hydrolase family 15 protein [Microbacterium gorillae]|uniref:glycoside hydrolase family 15 protein n=1 Tax=Microbacterium gorillae TaxID=1231063 RepID=UPI00058CCCFA|nr:glycoside hydrolase family 15 protein [Microbacterium gorillae]
MPARIEDHALLSDCRTAALVTADGDVDWFCPPRFDSPSAFAALLGHEEHGHWALHATGDEVSRTRRYDGGTFLLVTRWRTATGEAEVIDALPFDGDRTHLIRRVVGISGTVSFRTVLRIRFGYATALPWVRQLHDGSGPAIAAIAGPDAAVVRGIALSADGNSHAADFTIAAGDTRDLTMTWYPSWSTHPEPLDVDALLHRTRRTWHEWSDVFRVDGPHRELVSRSLLVLRALSHRDTGGIVAAPTTSLPELLGGARNWDYRYVWLRDAALVLSTLVRHGHLSSARHWRSWLLRSVAGDPQDVQIVYGVAGERDLAEREVDSLPGYDGAAPVRVGNGAVSQFQADVLGEVLVAMSEARAAGLAEERDTWSLQRALIEHVVAMFDRPDEGIWEIRGEPKMFTHSRALVWAALDHGVRAVREHGMSGDVDAWERLRDRVRADVFTHGVADGGWFTQTFGSDEVDASLLVLPQVGFCAWDDPHMLATVERIETDLMRDGFVLRYRTESGVDGLAGTENPFLACSFWLVEQYARTGRRDDADQLMERVCAVANDLGLLSEEYDTTAGRQVGNMPQAFSHLALVRAADALR